MTYENNWESLNARPVPEWFADAKFGIFIHWGVYSVPAFTKKGDYAEWYMRQIENPDSEARKFHDRVYGKDFHYEDFAGMFKAELFDANQWADIIKRSGAKYMNLVSKHHDGFCMYKSDYAWNWNSMDVGPHRDFCRELKTALEGTGVRFGVYHSVYEWFHPLYLKDPEEYALKHLHPMLKELITKYEPATLFTDGEWDHESSVWHSTEFLQWLYNESPVKDYIVPNDRWGRETRGRLGGNFTTEYGIIDGGRKIEDIELDRPFEECRGIGRSFGLNRAEMTEDYLSAKELLVTLCSLVAKGGNFLLNIGPAADGTIPVIMEERLLQMGQWLAVNGEAIYGTRLYTKKPQEHIYYTQKADSVFAIIDRFPFGSVTFDEIPYADGLKARLLSHPAPLTVENDAGKAKIAFPPIDPEEVTCEYLYAIEFSAGLPCVTVPEETAQMEPRQEEVPQEEVPQEEVPQEEVPPEEPAPEEETALRDITCGFGTPVACVFRDNRSDYELPVRTRGNVLIREADADRYPDRESLIRNVHETIIAAFPGALAGLSDTVYFWEIQKQTEPLKEAFEAALREKGILAEITVQGIGLNDKDADFIRENKKFLMERAQEKRQEPDAASPQPVESFVPGEMPGFITQPYPVSGMMDGPGMMYDPKKSPPSYLVSDGEAPAPQNTPDAEATRENGDAETASLTTPQPEAAIGAQPLRCPQCGAAAQNAAEKYCRNCGAPLR